MRRSSARGPMSVRNAAAQLIEHGYTVCRIEQGEKRPAYPRWTLQSADPGDIGPADGIGIVCGPGSGAPGHALVCVDLDSLDAVRRADDFLPGTPMVEGRQGKPRSHRWYKVPLLSIPEKFHSLAEQSAPAMESKFGHPGPRTLSFRDGARSEIVRLIGTGGQAVVPPSMHPCGERRAWETGLLGEPSVVAFKTLHNAVRRLARECGGLPNIEPSAHAAENARADVTHTALSHRLIYRVNRYLDELPASLSGRGGHDACYRAACILAWGFALPPDVVLQFLQRFNARCRPPWSESELRHKVREAAAATGHAKPRGHLV